jgi:DNA-binding MarR family transcriptional regulator
VSIADLDPVIHAPKRLAAMALLSTASTASFQFLKDHLGLTDSDLSKQMSALEAAGYISATKNGRGRGGSTTYRLTRSGRAAYRGHRAALQALLAAEPDDSED